MTVVTDEVCQCEDPESCYSEQVRLDRDAGWAKVTELEADLERLGQQEAALRDVVEDIFMVGALLPDRLLDNARAALAPVEQPAGASDRP